MNLHTRKILLLLGDVALLYVALYLSLVIRYGGAFDRELFSTHIAPFTGLYVVWLILFYIFDLYDLRAAPARGILVSRLLLAMLFMFFTGVTFFYAVNFTELTPKTNLVINVLVFGVWMAFLFFPSGFPADTVEGRASWDTLGDPGAFARDR